MKKYLAIAAIAALAGFVSCTKPDNTPVEKISVSPKSVTFAGEGGEQKVAVKTSESSFTATPDAAWLTVQISGKEIVLTASANTTGAERNCKVSLVDANSSCEIDVTQQIASPVPGYAPLTTKATLEYGGKQSGVNYPNENRGGVNFFRFFDFDGNRLDVWLFTEMFASAEDVKIVDGLYTVGEDTPETWYAVPGTWCPGDYFYNEAHGETYSSGSSFTTNEGVKTMITEGTVEIKDGVFKFDLKDEDGNEYKYAFSGEITISISAKFGPKISPEEEIYRAVHRVNSINEETGVVENVLMLYTGSEDNHTMTMITFYTDPAAESICGEYYNAADPAEEGTAGTAAFGKAVGGFLAGTGVLFNDGDVWVADRMVALYIDPAGDKYDIYAMLSDQSKTKYQPMAIIDIEFQDADGEEGEEE